MGIYLVIEANNGLILMWDRKTSLFIKLSSKYMVTLKKWMFYFKCGFDWFVQTTKDKLCFDIKVEHEHFFRVVCVGCVATMTTMQITTSPRGAMLWWWTPWCSGTAGRIYQTAPTLWARTAPAQPTPTDRRGPRNSAASYRAPSSLPATPL